MTPAAVAWFDALARADTQQLEVLLHPDVILVGRSIAHDAIGPESVMRSLASDGVFSGSWLTVHAVHHDCDADGNSLAVAEMDMHVPIAHGTAWVATLVMAVLSDDSTVRRIVVDADQL